jgi:hypothetical protein
MPHEVSEGFVRKVSYMRGIRNYSARHAVPRWNQRGGYDDRRDWLRSLGEYSLRCGALRISPFK